MPLACFLWDRFSKFLTVAEGIWQLAFLRRDVGFVEKHDSTRFWPMSIDKNVSPGLQYRWPCPKNLGHGEGFLNLAFSRRESKRFRNSNEAGGLLKNPRWAWVLLMVPHIQWGFFNVGLRRANSPMRNEEFRNLQFQSIFAWLSDNVKAPSHHSHL